MGLEFSTPGRGQHLLEHSFCCLLQATIFGWSSCKTLAGWELACGGRVSILLNQKGTVAHSGRGAPIAIAFVV